VRHFPATGGMHDSGLDDDWHGCHDVDQVVTLSNIPLRGRGDDRPQLRASPVRASLPRDRGTKPLALFVGFAVSLTASTTIPLPLNNSSGFGGASGLGGCRRRDPSTRMRLTALVAPARDDGGRMRLTLLIASARDDGNCDAVKDGWRIARS